MTKDNMMFRLAIEKEIEEAKERVVKESIEPKHEVAKESLKQFRKLYEESIQKRARASNGTSR